MKVLYVVRRSAREDIFPTQKLEELKKLAEVEVTYSTDQQTIKEKVSNVDIIIAATQIITSEIINAAKKLKMIQVTSAGFERLDVAAAAANGVIICNVSGANAISVVELCFGMILDLARRISSTDRLMRAGGWEKAEPERHFDVRNCTLGIVGLGAIGSYMAKIGKYGFDMMVLAYDPYISEDRAELVGAKLVDLPTLMKESDIVTIHVPFSEATRHLIGEKELGLMKPTAILVNSARGALVDEQALIKVLSDRKISGAGLDVFEIEPLPQESPIRKLENVVLYPHGASTISTSKHMYDFAVENVIRVARGQSPLNIQNPRTYYTSPKWVK